MGPKKNQPVKPTIAKLQNLDLGELTEETYIITKKRDIFFGEQRAKEIQQKLTAKRILTPMKEKTEPEPMKEKTEPQKKEMQQKRVANAMQITPSKEGKKKFLLFFFLQYCFSPFKCCEMLSISLSISLSFYSSKTLNFVPL